ncbi:unnamed protein product [Staurois parvus]|uniref:Uncharacterized protein n=1 Tax=Staurois parvus TaxID=386267 RepID=A0ABN9BVL4_9NEOB|nr:unnamed protein product [Staurois parvus]
MGTGLSGSTEGHLGHPRASGCGHRGPTRHWIVWLDSGHRVSPGMTAGTGSPGIRSFGIASGHRVIWQGEWAPKSPGTDSGLDHQAG